MNRTRLFAGAVAAASLAGCIMLPPPPPMFHRPPPPGFRGERGPQPSARDLCEARCAPGEPDAQTPGAR